MAKLYKEKEVKKKPKWFYPLIAVVAVLCIAAIGFFWYQGKKNASDPDKTIAKAEPNVESMGDEGDKKLEQEEGGGATSISYTEVATVNMKTKKVQLMYGNPTRSNYNAVVQVMLDDEAIATSGRIEPGNQVRELKLDKRVERKAGTYDGKLKIFFYAPDTSERAMVNTEIPITITIK